MRIIYKPLHLGGQNTICGYPGEGIWNMRHMCSYSTIFSSFVENWDFCENLNFAIFFFCKFYQNGVVQPIIVLLVLKYNSMRSFWVPQHLYNSIWDEFRELWKSSFLVDFYCIFLVIWRILTYFSRKINIYQFLWYVSYDDGEVLKMSAKSCTFKRMKASGYSILRFSAFLRKVDSIRSKFWICAPLA